MSRKTLAVEMGEKLTAKDERVASIFEDMPDEKECTVCNILVSVCGCTDEPVETNHLVIQTFTITRVVEFDGVTTHDRGLTIEFYGSDGPIQTVALESHVAAALRFALAKRFV